MLFRRKLITNFIWIIAMVAIIVMGAQYAFLYGIDFLFAGDSYLAQLVSVSYTALDVGLLAWIVIFLGLCVVVFLIGRGISRAVNRNLEIKPSVWGFIRIILTCLVFIGAIVYRGFMLISSGAVLLTDSTYYDAAAALFRGEAGLGELAVHGASFAYVMMLNFIMQFLGDRVVAVVLLQIVIQILTIMFVFAAAKRLVNYCTGFITALMLTVSPLYTAKVFTSSPGCFVALLLVFAIYMISLFIKIRPGVLKGIAGLLIGAVIGYLIYMDAVCVLALIAWFFAMVYEWGDPDRGGFPVTYVLMFLGMIIGAGVSIALDGGFDIDGIGIAALTWLKVSSVHLAPEYALMDPSLGLPCLLQCMILVGASSMTVMGTIGRDHVEYEYPWIMMLVCAVTPMTRIGYLQDNTVSYIVYLMLAGAGVSAMLYVPEETDEDEDEDEDTDEAAEQESEEVLFEDISGNEPASAPMAAEPEPAPTEAAEPETATEAAPEESPVDIPEEKPSTVPEEKPAAAPAENLAATPAEEAAEEAEELPTSIPWAEIKKLDDEENEPEPEIYEEEVYTEEALEEDIHEDETVAQPDPATTQVDDLPGMIPNPLPLPPKRVQTEMDYDLDDEDEEDFDDDWDDGDFDDDDFDYN